MTTSMDAESWAEKYRIAWITADSQAVSALFAEDGTYRSDIYEDPHRGRAGIEAYWSDVCAGQSDVAVQMGTPMVEGQRAMVEFWTTMAIEDVPVTLAGSLLLRFEEGGLCSELREYWNFIDGTHQPPDGWGG